MENLINNLQITDITEDGRGIARVNNQVVFVKNTVPGDVVDAMIYRKKRRFLEGEMKQLVVPSNYRTQPLCSHFGVCGGCKWQHLEYNEQLKYKQKQVNDALERLAGINEPVVLPIIPSQQVFNYRNKLEFTFSNKEWMTKSQLDDKNYTGKPALGFHMAGLFDKVLNIEECHLQSNFQNKIRNRLKETALKNHVSFYNIKSQDGFLRNLVLRNNQAGDWMVVLIVKEDCQEWIELLLTDLITNFKEVKSAYYIVNGKKNDNYSDLNPILFYGEETIIEKLDELNFKIGPKTFFQTNTAQAINLYRVAKEYASLTGFENVYDLYTGTGTIALYVAGNAKHVTGVEYVQASIDAAHINSKENGVNNVAFYSGDMKDVFSELLFQKHGNPDVIITDPPRAGMHEEVVKAIAKSGAQRVVYVSCNAPTQARDIKMMSDQYAFVKAQPVDMFPHTSHVENVALLERCS